MIKSYLPSTTTQSRHTKTITKPTWPLETVRELVGGDAVPANMVDLVKEGILAKTSAGFEENVDVFSGMNSLQF